jgi:integrase
MAVRSWLAGLHEASEVTPTTIAKAYRLLRRILNVAVEAGYLPRNPAVIKGAGLERAAEMRHVSIPQLHAVAEAVRRRYRALVLVAGYGGLRWGELDGLRFHDLRHTAATLAAAAGATTRELMERMGHTSPAVALRYQHVMADRQGAIAAALDGLARDAEKKDRLRPRARGGHDGQRRGSGNKAAGS